MKVRARMVCRDGKPPSRLESRVETLWRALGGPVLEKEFRFHPVRKWRADFAHMTSRTLIEIEGGIYDNRGAGFAADLSDHQRHRHHPPAGILPPHGHPPLRVRLVVQRLGPGNAAAGP